jgi:hypothetical protein
MISHSVGRRVLESRVLRKIFGPKRDEVAGSGGDFYNEELHDFVAEHFLLYCLLASLTSVTGGS